MPAVRLSKKLCSTLSIQRRAHTTGSASGTGAKSTATTLPSKSAPKPVSALEEKLLFQIRAIKLPEPVREFRFHDTRRWRADFAWPERRLLVEVEGGHWANGRHTRGSGFEADCEKYSEAALDGWTVLRFTGTHIKDGRALQMIERALQ